MEIRYIAIKLKCLSSKTFSCNGVSLKYR